MIDKFALRLAAAAVMVVGTMMPARARAETFAGVTGTVSSATGTAHPVGVGVYGESDGEGWVGVQAWYTYFPGHPGTDAAAIEGLLMAPIRGFGVKVRPFLGAGVAGTHDRVPEHPDTAQPIFSLGALVYMSEGFGMVLGLHNGALSDNGTTRDHRSWSVTVAIGKRF